MKRIEWNTVTWYSKLIAVFLFFIIWMMGIYLGSEVQRFPLPRTNTEDAIAPGKPCHIVMGEIVPDTITDTKGLRCRISGPGRPRPVAFWIAPSVLPTLNYYGTEFGGTPEMGFQSAHEVGITYLTKDWATYTSPDKKLRFKYPKEEWVISMEKTEGDGNLAGQSYIIDVSATSPQEGVSPFQIEYSTTPLKAEDLEFLASFTENNALNDHLQFMEGFSLNGNTMYAMTQLPIVDFGADGQGLRTTFYVIKDPNGMSALKFTYARDNNLEGFIRSIHLE